MYYEDSKQKQKRVIILARKSTAKQMREDDKDDVPIPVQKEVCVRYMKEYHPDWVYLDDRYEQKSAYNNTSDELKVLNEILEMAKRKEFEILLIYYSDRLSRLSDDGMYFIKTLFQCGVEVWSTKEGQLKIGDLNDKLHLFLTFYSAEMESQKTSERVKDAQKRMIRQGRHVGGIVPYGYEYKLSDRIGLHNRILSDIVIVPEQAEVVKEMFRLATEKMYGAYKIAKILNEKGIKNSNGQEWKACTIHDMLMNPLYKGKLVYGRRNKKQDGSDHEITECDEPLEYLRIIDDVTWEKAQMIRKNRCNKHYNPNKESYVSTNGILLFGKKIYCGYCGSSLSTGTKYVWKNKGYQKIQEKIYLYKCNKKTNGSPIEHKQYCYYQHPLEEKILSNISQFMNQLKTLDIDNKVKEVKAKTLDDLNSKIEILDAQLKKVQDDILILQSYLPNILQGKSSLEFKTIADAISNNEHKKDSLETQINDLKNKLNSVLLFNELDTFVSLIPKWDDEFNNADIQRKKVLIDAVINRVTVSADRIDIDYKFNNLVTENPFTHCEW